MPFETNSAATDVTSGGEIIFKIPKELREKLEAEARERGPKQRSNIIREALESRYAAKEVNIERERETVGQLRLRHVAKGTCGDWREAVELGGNIVLSQDIADHLEARGGDVTVTTEGDSMDPEIPDGALLLMRPLSSNSRPRPGEVVLVQIIDEYGNVESTIKRWAKGGSTPRDIRLEDGSGNPVPIPEGTQNVIPVAVARGMITKL